MRLCRYSQVWMLPDRGKPAHGTQHLLQQAAAAGACASNSALCTVSPGARLEVQTQVRLRHARSAAPSGTYREPYRGSWSIMLVGPCMEGAPRTPRRVDKGPPRSPRRVDKVFVIFMKERPKRRVPIRTDAERERSAWRSRMAEWMLLKVRRERIPIRELD